MNKFEQEGQQEEDVKKRDDQMSDEFTEFVGKGGWSTAEVKSAYYRAFAESEQTENTDHLTPLVAKMKELSTREYPITRFVKFINLGQELRVAKEDCRSFIPGLPLTDKEKYLLLQIVDGKRTGVLEIFIGEKRFDVMNVHKEEDIETTTWELLRLLKAAKASHAQTPKKEFSITFTS